MTPTEALEVVRAALSVGTPDSEQVERALTVLDRLCSKDAAERTFPVRLEPLPKLVCTCQTTTPCKLWGHS